MEFQTGKSVSSTVKLIFLACNLVISENRFSLELMLIELPNSLNSLFDKRPICRLSINSRLRQTIAFVFSPCRQMSFGLEHLYSLIPGLRSQDNLKSSPRLRRNSCILISKTYRDCREHLPDRADRFTKITCLTCLVGEERVRKLCLTWSVSCLNITYDTKSTQFRSWSYHVKESRQRSSILCKSGFHFMANAKAK
jgi:hypothetical protein